MKGSSSLFRMFLAGTFVGSAYVTPVSSAGAQATVKAGARVRLPGTGPEICESARKARERNSPAAPGLERQCQAALDAARAAAAPVTSATICESARQARERNSPAAPGLEARCTAMRASEVRNPGAQPGTSGATLPAEKTPPGSATPVVINNVYISQVYGGGGSAGAALPNDYIEIFNGGNTPVDVTGWAVQYASYSGTTWQVTPLRGTVIPPGGYYLIHEAAGGTSEMPMPGYADASGTISMAAAAGKVALTQNITALATACPSGAVVVDRVSYGENSPTTGCGAEWGGGTGILSSTSAAYRNDDGCAYTGSSSVDFTVLAAIPRNSASSAKLCPAVANKGDADAATPAATPNTSGVYISQVYGGGGSADAVLPNDYIEIFNSTNAPVDVTGWAVQYASFSGTTWQVTPLRGTVIPPGGYYLIHEAAGGASEMPMPGYADATGTISMAAAAGKVALTRNTTALAAACPSGGAVVDRVSYGENTTTSGCGAEWGGRTGMLSGKTAAHRNNGGCTYTGSSSADFALLAANPRNSASPPKSCAE